ncbi:hypothetical protein Tco_0516102 [Tanacetum coccineum]
MGQLEVGAQAQNDLPLYRRSTVASTVQCKMRQGAAVVLDGDGGDVAAMCRLYGDEVGQGGEGLCWLEVGGCWKWKCRRGCSLGWGCEVVVATGSVVEVRLVEGGSGLMEVVNDGDELEELMEMWCDDRGRWR